MVDLPRETRLAILIDAENISPVLVKQVLIRLQPFQALTLKRAYGDWSRASLGSWKPVLLEWGIHPIYAPTYTASKNSADMALTIDALDLLYEQKIDWFCLVTHDSDFTPLVHRLIKSGVKVIGFGSARASKSFANACHKFISLEANPATSQPSQLAKAVQGATPTLQAVPSANTVPSTDAPPSANAASANTVPPANAQASSKAITTKEQLRHVLQEIFGSLSQKNNWVNLGQVHTRLQKRCANFSCKRFGYSGLVKLVEDMQIFELRQRQANPENPKQVMVEIRLKQAV